MKKHREWLRKELPLLEEEGVLSMYYAQALREHYALEEQEDDTGPFPVTILLGILGAFLVGGGLILLLGHNWHELTRSLRTVLIFCFLLLSQGFVGWVLLRRRRSVAARETSAVLNVLFVAAAIALIGQTYHIPGNLTSFLLVWMLLSLPVCYLLGSVVAALLYLAGSTAWGISLASDGGSAAWFWLLYAAILPFAVVRLRDVARRGAGACLAWGLCLHATVAGCFLASDIPGVWILVYTSLFACMYLTGVAVLQPKPPWVARPFLWVGSVGGLVLAYLLTYEWPWSGSRYGARWSGWTMSSWVDVLLWAGLTATVVCLIVRVVRETGWRDAIQGVAPVLALLLWAAAQFGAAPGLAMLGFNVYLVVLGVLWMALGIREASLARLNIGMIVLMVLLLLRFFDSEIPMVVRGVVYMLLGGIVWGVNLFMLKRRRKAGLA